MVRKLASVQKITDISSIKDADKIEKLQVLGWELVSKKNEFKVGDLCVYFEIDSVLPEKPWSEFMKDRKYRVKTIKLKGQVSQGLALPLTILPVGNYTEGTDVTALLGVTKYEAPAERQERLEQEARTIIFGKKIDTYLKRYGWFRKLISRPERDKFPSFISKTDEDRIQLFPNICEEHKDTKFVVTEKLDGSSATYFVIKNPTKWQFWKPYIFGVCSRRLRLYDKNNVWWKVAIEQDIEKKLITYATLLKLDMLAIQGELIGEGVQGNKYDLKGHDLYLFNLIENGVKQNHHHLLFFSSNFGLNTCPVLKEAWELKPTIHDCVEESKGKSLVGSKPTREGIVVRNYDKNISFKIINPDFLLKYD